MKRLLFSVVLVGLVWLACASRVDAAISLVTQATCNSTSTAATTTMSCSLTATGGATSVMYCWFFSNDNAVDLTPAVVWNTTESFTQVSEVGTAGSGRYVWIGRRKQPTSGAHTADFSGMSSAAQDSGGCFELSGVDQTTPDDTPVTNVGVISANPQLSSTVTSNGWIISCVGWANAADPAPDGSHSNQSLIHHSAPATASADAACAYDSTGTNDEMAWATSGTPSYGMISFDVNADGGAGGADPLIGLRSTLGVGK